ncbi:hypothetical protein FSP39_017613 [Pinctada imbricata]|uniref:Uncharacterized protein n=1 Tax=Pinctada imbricata TaxID=66713 RepID=A0AA89C273_PINIB|nr:hypothetical protein FSP39_017613 [Pinctada imbricata]
MANLFDKLSGTLSKLSDDKPTNASTKLRKNSSKSSTDSCRTESNLCVDDQGSVSNNQDGANGSKIQSGGRVENETPGVQQFVIPKKSTQKSDRNLMLSFDIVTGLFVDLMINSREFQHEILPSITKNYKFSTSSSRFSYVKVQSVHNKELMNQYLEKRKDLRKHGYNEKEIGDSVAFLCVEKEEEARKLCTEGLSIGNMKHSLLGDPALGVQLSRHSDVLTLKPFPPLFSGYLVLFKVIKGRVKTVVESENHLEPTPNHDCHITGTISTEGSVSHESVYFSTQIYMYEYGENSLPVNKPRNICPMAIVHFMYDSDRIKGHRGPAAGLMHIHGTSYNIGPGWHGNSDDQEEYVVWTGNLTVKGLYACLVNMKSIGSCIKPAKIGQHINITHKMEANQARRKYLPNVCGLHRRAEGHWNGTYINVCELHPEDNESRGHFQRIMNYLGKHNSVAIVKVDKENVLLLLPASELSYHLGLSKPHQYPVLLYCLFLSKKSMKHRVGVSEKSSQKSVDPRKQLRISVQNSSDHGHHSPSIPPSPIHSTAWSQGMSSPKPKWSTPTKESPSYRQQSHPGTPSPTSASYQWSRPHPQYTAQGSSPVKPWITSPSLSTMPPPNNSQFLPPSPSHFPPQSVSSHLPPSPSMPPSLTLRPTMSMPPSPVHQNQRFPPPSPTFQSRTYPPTPEHNGMNSYPHLNPAFTPVFSSPNKFQMGPQGMTHSPQSGHSAHSSHSSLLEPPRTPPSDPRLHGNQRSPSLSQYRGTPDLTPTKSPHDATSRSPFSPNKYFDKQQSFSSSGASPVGSRHSPRYMTSPLGDTKKPNVQANMNFDNGFKSSPVPNSLLTKDKIKKEFLSQMEIIEVKQRLKAKLAKAEAEKEQPVEMTESDMEIIKRGYKTKSSGHLDPQDGNKKYKPEKKKPVSPALSKEANEMKEFLDSGLDKKKKPSEKKVKPPPSSSEKVSEKKTVSTPSQSQTEKTKSATEAVKIKVPELKLDSLEDIANMRRMVDLEIQKGKERMPKLEEERKRLAAELEGKSKMKLEKRKKHPSEICDEQPKEKVPRREDLNSNNMKEKMKSGVDKAKVSPTTQSASEMCDFLNQETEDVKLTPDVAVSKGHNKTDKSSDKVLEKETPYFDLADDIKNVSKEKTNKEEESYKGKKKMAVKPMIEDKAKKNSIEDESLNKKDRKEDSKSEPKGRWDSVTKRISERRGTEGSSDGEGERKVEKKNGGKIIIIREIKYVDKKEKEGHSDSDASNASHGRHSKKSKDSKRKLKEHGQSQSEKSKSEHKSRPSKGLVKYSDSDTCSEKSHGSRESSREPLRSDYHRHEPSSGDSKAKRFKSDGRSRVMDESGDHRDRDRSYEMYQNRMSKDGRSMGPRHVVGLSTSHRSHQSKDRITINGIVTKDEVSNLYKIPKLPKIPKRKKSTDAQPCSICSLLCRPCDCSTACAAIENVSSVSCETKLNSELSNQNLPQNDSKTDQNNRKPEKSKENGKFDLQNEKGENIDGEQNKRRKGTSISDGAGTSKLRSSQSILENIMSSFRDSVRKSRSGKLEANTKSRLSTADSILEEMAEINETVSLLSENEDNDDVFLEASSGKDDKSCLDIGTSFLRPISSSLSVNRVETASISYKKGDSMHFGSLPSSRSNSPIMPTNLNRTFDKAEGDFFRVKFTPGKNIYREANRCHKVFDGCPRLDKGVEPKSCNTEEEDVDPNFCVDPDRVIEVAGKEGQDLRISVPNDAPNLPNCKCISREEIISLCLHGPASSKLSPEEQLQLKSVTTVLHRIMYNSSYERSVTNDNATDNIELPSDKADDVPQDIPPDKAANSDGVDMSEFDSTAENKEETLDRSCEVTSTNAEKEENNALDSCKSHQEKSSDITNEKIIVKQDVVEENNNSIMHPQNESESKVEDKGRNAKEKDDGMYGPELPEHLRKRQGEIVDEGKGTDKSLSNEVPAANKSDSGNVTLVKVKLEKNIDSESEEIPNGATYIILDEVTVIKTEVLDKEEPGQEGQKDVNEQFSLEGKDEDSAIVISSDEAASIITISSDEAGEEINTVTRGVEAKSSNNQSESKRVISTSSVTSTNSKVASTTSVTSTNSRVASTTSVTSTNCRVASTCSVSSTNSGVASISSATSTNNRVASTSSATNTNNRVTSTSSVTSTNNKVASTSSKTSTNNTVASTSNVTGTNDRVASTSSATSTNNRVASTSSATSSNRITSTSSVASSDHRSEVSDSVIIKSGKNSGAVIDTLDVAVNDNEMAKFDLDEMKFEIATEKLKEQKGLQQVKESRDLRHSLKNGMESTSKVRKDNSSTVSMMQGNSSKDSKKCELSATKTSEKVAVRSDMGKNENLLGDLENKSTKRKDIHPEKLLQKALSAVSIRKPITRLPEDDRKSSNDSKCDKNVKKPSSEKSSAQSTSGSESKRESKSSGPGSSYQGNTPEVGPTRTLTTDSRRNRQFHPYKKEKKPEKKNSWSFDISYNSLRELMQDLTTESYRRLHSKKHGIINKYNTPPRFSHYKFRRSAVPDTLPDSPDEENDDFTEEAIPDFEERKRKADLVEQMMEEGVEDEAYCNEKKVYQNDEQKQIQASTGKPQTKEKETVESRLSRIALGDHSVLKDAQSTATSKAKSTAASTAKLTATSTASSQQPSTQDDDNKNVDLRHVITQMKSSSRRSVSPKRQSLEKVDNDDASQQKKGSELAELAVSENKVSSSVGNGVRATSKTETSSSIEEHCRKRRESAVSFILSKDGYKLIPINLDSNSNNKYTKRETFGFKLLTADFWREDPRTLKDKHIFKEELKKGYKVKGLVVNDTDTEFKNDLCKSENEYLSELENTGMSESLNASFNEWIVVDEVHGGASDCEVNESRDLSDVNCDEENVCRSNSRKVILKEMEVKKDCSDDIEKSQTSLISPETQMVDEESLLTQSSSQITDIEEEVKQQNREESKEEMNGNDRKVILKDEELVEKDTVDAAPVNSELQETDPCETENFNVMKLDKDETNCDEENSEKSLSVQNSQHNQPELDSKDEVSVFENEDSVQGSGVTVDRRHIGSSCDKEVTSAVSFIDDKSEDTKDNGAVHDAEFLVTTASFLSTKESTINNGNSSTNFYLIEKTSDTSAFNSEMEVKDNTFQSPLKTTQNHELEILDPKIKDDQIVDGITNIGTTCMSPRKNKVSSDECKSTNFMKSITDYKNVDETLKDNTDSSEELLSKDKVALNKENVELQGRELHDALFRKV